MDKGYNNNGYSNDTGNMNMNFGGNNIGNLPGYTLWLILGIVQACSICCCGCITTIFGIITIIFAVGANNMFKQGNTTGALSKLKTAKIVNVIGWFSWVIICIISFVTGIAEGIIDSIRY